MEEGERGVGGRKGWGERGGDGGRGRCGEEILWEYEYLSSVNANYNEIVDVRTSWPPLHNTYTHTSHHCATPTHSHFSPLRLKSQLLI